MLLLLTVNTVLMCVSSCTLGGAPAPAHWNPIPPQVAKYNWKTSVWTEVAPMQIPLNHTLSAACVLNGKIYVTGVVPLQKAFRQ